MTLAQKLREERNKKEKSKNSSKLLTLFSVLEEEATRINNFDNSMTVYPNKLGLGLSDSFFEDNKAEIEKWLRDNGFNYSFHHEVIVRNPVNIYKTGLTYLKIWW